MSFIGLKSQLRFPGLILRSALNPKKVTARRNGNFKGSLGDEMMLLPLVVGERSRRSPRFTAFIREVTAGRNLLAVAGVLHVNMQRAN